MQWKQLLVTSSLLFACAAVTTSASANDIRDIMRRASQTLEKATERAMAECQTTHIDVTTPTYDYKTKAETTKNMTVTIEWSGGCVDGKHGRLVDHGKVKWPGQEDDMAYLSALAFFFEQQWGKGPDDVGSLERSIDFVLQF